MGTTTPAPTAAHQYRIGEPDFECRWPVIIDKDGEELVLGKASRFHRDWFALSSAGERNLRRPKKGTHSIDMTAAFLVEEYAAGHITAVPLDQVLAEAPQPLYGPVPLLDPRMPVNDRNIRGAHTAFEGLREHFWRAVRSGFPGSDNPWFLLCELCGWTGIRWWSHLRGRNGNPPSPYRHEGGCVGKDKVIELIAAYHDAEEA